MSDEKFRYLLRFSKQGPLRFIGHLDLLRVFQQTVRRAGLPVAYSQGFNPHQLISFALPLPLGMASENDYAEIYFTGTVDADEVTAKFNSCCPEGLALTLVKFFPDGPGVAACACAADYEWKADVQEEKVDALLSRKEIIIPKKTKSGVKDTDIRPDIYEVTLRPGAVYLRLAAGSQRFLNPLTAAGLFLPKAKEAGAAGQPGDFTAGADQARTPNESVTKADQAGQPGGSAAKVDPGQFIRKELYRLDSNGALVKLSGFSCSHND